MPTVAGTAAPVSWVAVASSVMISLSILRLITPIVVCCMIARWSPCDAKTLNPVLRTRSCHSASVATGCERLSARAGIRPFTPRVTAVAPPLSATRNVI